jgi:spermidine synthase
MGPRFLPAASLAGSWPIGGSPKTVYPGSWAMLATHSLETSVVGLVARREGGRFDAGLLRRRIASMGVPGGAPAFGTPDEVALLGGSAAGPQALRRFSADAPLNADDHPVVAYRAPRATHEPDSTPAGSIVALVREMHLDAAELIAGSSGTDAGMLSARLTRYWRARAGPQRDRENPEHSAQAPASSPSNTASGRSAPPVVHNT